MLKLRLKKLLSSTTFKFLYATISVVALSITILYIFSPLPIPYAGKIVSTMVEKKIGNIKIDIKNTYLSSGTKPSNINIKFSNIEVSYQNSAKLTIPDIKVDLNILKLLTLNYESAITGIFFSNKSIEASFINDKTHSKDQNLIPIKTINHHLMKNFHLFENKKIFLEDLKFNIGFNKEHSILLNIKQLTAYLHKDQGKINIIIDALINAGDNPIKSHFTIDTFSNNFVLMKGKLKSVHSQFIEILNNEELSKLAQSIDFNLDINLNAQAKYLNRLENLHFDLSQNDLGYFDNPYILNNKTEIKGLKLNGHCNINCSLLTIDNINGVLNQKIKFSGKADLKNLDQFTSKFKFSDINTSEIYENWPNIHISNVKNWLKENLKTGKINTLNFRYNDQTKAFNLSFDVLKAKLSYLYKVPTININNAKLTIDNKSLSIYTDNASFGQNKINHLTGHIDNFHSKDLKMEIEAKLKGPLTNQIHLAYAHSDEKNTFSGKIVGTADTSLSFNLPLENDINLKNLDFKLQSKLDNVAIKKLAGDHYINNGSFVVDLKNLNLKADGVAYLNGKLPSKINLFIPLNKQEYYIYAGIDSSANKFREAGIEIPNFIDDNLSVKTNIDIIRNTKIYKGSIDLNQTSVNLSGIGIMKKPNVDGSVDFNLTQKNNDDLIKIENYKISLPQLGTSGNGTINTQKQKIIYLKSTNTKFYDSNLQYLYDDTKEKKTLNLYGNTINLQNANILDLIKSLDTGKSNQDFIFSTNIKQIKLKNNLDFHDAKLKLNKKDGKELSGEFIGKLPNQEKFHLYYNNPVLSIVSGDAGQALSALGLYNHMNSGSLEIKGEFIDKENFIGSLYITNFFIKKAPTLTKILGLNIAAITPNSLVGITNLLDGKGIKFSNFDCPIRYSKKDKILKFDNCIANGSILKIKVTGEINFDTKYLNASGALIQANIFNKVFGKLPFFGKLLSGGKDEGVIFTITYNIYGYLDDDLKVKANYLSYITPGFLRALLNNKK